VILPPLVFPMLSVVAPSSLFCLVVEEEKKEVDDVAGAGTTGSLQTETNRLGPGTKFCSKKSGRQFIFGERKLACLAQSIFLA